MDNSMEWLRMINEMKKDAGMTIPDIAARSGIPIGTLNKILSGTTRMPHFQAVQKIVYALGHTLSELDDESRQDVISQQERTHIRHFRMLDDHGRETVEVVLQKEVERMRLIEAERNRRQAAERVRKARLFSLPHEEKPTVRAFVYSSPAAAGQPIYADSSGEWIRVEEDGIPDDMDFGIRIQGDSMEPTIPNGSIVWVRQQPDIDGGDIGIFMFDEEERAVCKRARKDSRGRLCALISDNDAYAPIPVDRSNPARCVGRVLAVYGD